MRVALTLSAKKLPKSITEAFLRSLIRETCLLAYPKIFGDKSRGVNIEVVFVTDSEIAKLNGEYREKPKPTDVLSFGEFETPESVKKATAKTLELGTLILSLPFIKRSAEEDGVSWEKEFIFVFSHGILHLLGHDHSKVMFAIQDEVTEKFSRL